MYEALFGIIYQTHSATWSMDVGHVVSFATQMGPPIKLQPHLPAEASRAERWYRSVGT